MSVRYHQSGQYYRIMIHCTPLIENHTGSDKIEVEKLENPKFIMESLRKGAAPVE